MKRVVCSTFKLSVVAFFSLFFFTLCNDPDTIECCTGFGIVEKSYVFDTTTGDTVTVKLYSAMTPLNKHFCDSMVFDSTVMDWQLPYEVRDAENNNAQRWDLLCSPEEALEAYLDGCRSCCPCRTNPDTIYNYDENDLAYNDYFYIEGINDFPSNKLFLRVPGDTTKIKQFFDYDNKTGTFAGEITMDSTLYGRSPINKMLQSGKYEYELILYSDSLRTESIDTIIGYFCIIRTPDDENENCVGADDGDPLIN